MQVFDNNEFDKNQWYMAVSNHQSWADIFILLVAAHKRIPLLKFFMKKELAWIPFVFLANKTLNMPFVNRHSKKQLEKNPNLRFKDYENTLLRYLIVSTYSTDDRVIKPHTLVRRIVCVCT